MTSRFMAGASVFRGNQPWHESLGADQTYRNGKTSGHPVEIIWVFAHDCDLGNDCFACPFDTKDFSELLQIFGGCFSY